MSVLWAYTLARKLVAIIHVGVKASVLGVTVLSWGTRWATWSPTWRWRRTGAPAARRRRSPPATPGSTRWWGWGCHSSWRWARSTRRRSRSRRTPRCTRRWGSCAPLWRGR
uniref:Uncharacterized protein n=1 Tax=Triticum urartu TaxID=4572 RepID=A0A8R7R9X6_TRIUA